MRPITLRKLTLAAVLLGIVAVTSVISVPGRWVFAPEWITAANTTGALGSLALAALAGRWLWLWIRWWSIPISLVLTVVAAALASWSVNDVLVRMRSPPAEGFAYTSDLACGINVDGVFRDARMNDRIYVLQQFCVPDGPEDRWIYRRHGNSPVMERLDPRSDAKPICEAWRTSRTWMSPSRFNRDLVSPCTSTRVKQAGRARNGPTFKNLMQPEQAAAK